MSNVKTDNYNYPMIRKRFAGGKVQSFFTDYTLISDDAVYKCVGQFEDGVKGWVLLVPRIIDNIFVGHTVFEWGII